MKQEGDKMLVDVDWPARFKCNKQKKNNLSKRDVSEYGCDMKIARN